MDYEKLAQLLGVDNGPAVEFCLDNAAEIICGYCHVETVPDGLQNICCRMAMDIYRNEGPGENTSSGPISTYTEGDVSVSYGARFDDSFKASLMKNYEVSLRPFRKVVFT
jgi:hypothetical protein